MGCVRKKFSCENIDVNIVNHYYDVSAFVYPPNNVIMNIEIIFLTGTDSQNRKFYVCIEYIKIKFNYFRLIRGKFNYEICNLNIWIFIY